MSESYHWWDFLPRLQNLYKNDQFSAVDILGNGQFCSAKTPLSIKKNISALQNQINFEGRKIIIGFSLGGILALEWARNHPEEVEAIILINCSSRDSAFYKRLKLSAIYNIIKMGLKTNLSVREQNILQMTTNGLDSNQLKEIASDWGNRSQQFPVKSINFFRQLVLAGFMKKNNQPTVPTLILCSEKDKVVSSDCSKTIAKKWNCPVMTHPTAGHDLTLEDPDWVIDQINQFITNLKLSQIPINNRSNSGHDFMHP